MTTVTNERWQGTLDQFTAYNMYQQNWNRMKTKRYHDGNIQRKYPCENRVFGKYPNNYHYISQPSFQFFENNFFKKGYTPYVTHQEINSGHRDKQHVHHISPPPLTCMNSPIKSPIGIRASPEHITKPVRIITDETKKEVAATIKRRRFSFTKNDLDKHLYGHIDDGKQTRTYNHSISEIMSEDIKEDDIKPFINELPSSLTIDILKIRGISHVGVFAREKISKGTRFGPFKGTDVLFDKDGPKFQFSWEVFKKDNSFKLVDGTSENQNWMKFVKPARFENEQNLYLNQIENELYFDASNDIEPGKELLVWYGNQTKWFVNVKSKDTEEAEEKEEFLGQKDMTSGSFPCTRCGKIFSYEYYRDKHLKYTRCVDMGDRKFPCHLCQRSFEKKDRLRIHILHVHQKYRPHVCKVCGKRFSQSSSLNKHTRVHTGERPYQCPHCPKSFTASSILRTHLRQHNGERPFKCKFCSKAFASHAAHDSHVRRTHEQLKKYFCSVCKKSFSMEFELTFHMGTHTTEELKTIRANSSDSYEDFDVGNMSDDSIIVD